MMKADYCAYPPQLAADVEIAEQRDGDRAAFVIGSLSVGRFLLLREIEEQVRRLLNDSRTPAAVCAEFERQHGAALSLPTLTRFLAKLDEAGILSGERAHRPPPSDGQPNTQFYWRFKLFNPDRLFARLVGYLRWVWTPGFVFSSVALMLMALLLALASGAEVTSYSLYVVREHYLMILIASELIAFSHELAHGLTCKAFGGRVPEVGVLQIYYVLPALYCNVSGIHLIPQRNRRLWVIAAGIYWQVLVGTISLLAWFLLAPYTLLADLAFCFFLAGVVDVIFNANPLIKLDGYYFLSQWLRLPNLMDRARAYWRELLKRILFGERHEVAAQWNKRERVIYAVFGALSFIYTVGLRMLIVFYVGSYLADWFHLAGLLMAGALALFYARQPLRQLPLRQLIAAAALMIGGMEKTMNTNKQGATQPKWWRRRLVPLTIGLVLAVILCLPWQASIGNYGALIAIPGEETIIRAPESATLLNLKIEPGQQIAAGSVVGQMGNLELEEQMVQAQSELARVNADYSRLLGELRTREEGALRAGMQLRQRQHEYDEINAERQQIERRHIAETNLRQPQIVSASTASMLEASTLVEPLVPVYPAALAVLQAEAEACRAQLAEAAAQRGRTRQLYAQGIVPRSELDAVETRAMTLASAREAARERLEAALIAHRRQHSITATELDVARSNLGAERLQTEKLTGELNAMRIVLTTLEERRTLLERKRAQFALITPRTGTVFGEELPRQVGHYFQKGAEVCRIADTRHLLLRVKVPEREIGDVRLGHPVRLRTRAFPERVFQGVVSKISSESEGDENNQVTCRVELQIENVDGSLRPGMTAFARIDFDRQRIGSILLHKIKQALRPELWLL